MKPVSYFATSLHEAHTTRAAEELLFERGCEIDFSPPSDDVFYFGAAIRAVKKMEIAYYNCQQPSEARLRESSTVRQQFIFRGNFSTKVGSREYSVTPDVSCVLSAHSEIKLSCSGSFEELVVCIPEEALLTRIVALLGVLPRNRLQFSPGVTDPASMERMRRVLFLLLDEAKDNASSPLLLAELENLFLTQFLLTNRHNYIERLNAHAVPGSKNQVRLVESYIEANWDKPLSVEDIARIAGMPVRSLYAAFMRCRGYGPNSFLRQVRLNKARELLLAGELSVTAVAQSCGFSNPGQFSNYYQTAFGELPSHTRGAILSAMITARDGISHS